MKLSIIENEQDKHRRKSDVVTTIISAYSGVIIRLYAFIRFRIIRLRFLEEIEQYLPESGVILDLGCGFGLFAIYMAMRKPDAQIVGLDVNEKRLHVARSAATKLGIRNVTFTHGNLRDWHPDRTIAGGYSLDVFHHIPVATGNRLLAELSAHIAPGGRFVLKDIDTRPRSMLWFTYLLDLLMSPRDDFFYRSASEWKRQLASSGFAPIRLHYLWDILPYPHILLICDKPGPPR